MSLPVFNIQRTLKYLAASQQFRFVFVGTWNTVVGYSLFVAAELLLGKKINTIVALVASYCLSLPLAFLMQRIFVFRVKASILMQFSRFCIANSTIFAANLIFLPFALLMTHGNPIVIQGCFVIVSAVVSFFAHKHFSFSEHP